jgi:hypothetical protein
MKMLYRIAMFSIAVCAVPTASLAQKVYRCGSTYSQIPCADGVTVEVQDTRSKVQKSQAQATIKSETSQAQAMEERRMKEEAQALKANPPVLSRTREHDLPKSSGAPPIDTDKKSAANKKTKEPEYFTAQVLAEKKKKAASAPR